MAKMKNPVRRLILFIVSVFALIFPLASVVNACTVTCGSPQPYYLPDRTYFYTDERADIIGGFISSQDGEICSPGPMNYSVTFGSETFTGTTSNYDNCSSNLENNYYQCSLILGHPYPVPGTHPWSMTYGPCSGSGTVEIRSRCNPACSATVTNIDTLTGLVDFSARVTGQYCYGTPAGPPLFYQWCWGDTTAACTDPSTADTIFTQNSHTYSKGTYNWSMTAWVGAVGSPVSCSTTGTVPVDLCTCSGQVTNIDADTGRVDVKGQVDATACAGGGQQISYKWCFCTTPDCAAQTCTMVSSASAGFHTLLPGTYTWTMNAQSNGVPACSDFGTVTVPEALDHFEVTGPGGSALGDQVATTPFPVQITARGRSGSVYTSYSGPVSLSSNSGAISPKGEVPLVNGTGMTIVTLFKGGIGTFLSASGLESKSGRSNEFTVTTPLSNKGSIAGMVRDQKGNPLAAAMILLSLNKTGSFAGLSVADNAGVYGMQDIPCGKYYLKGGKGTKGSPFYEVNVRCDDGVITQDIVIEDCTNGVLTPVLLVPGVMGSTLNSWAPRISPRLPEYVPAWDSGQLKLHDPFWQAGWSSLSSDLESWGYEKGCTLFEVPYDWRSNISYIAGQYLKPWIDLAKQKSGKAKVDIVAHSMGGLVSRSYIQSGAYENDVRGLVMAATPNNGSANTYYLWEGADPGLIDNILEDPLSFYSETLRLMYLDLYGFLPPQAPAQQSLYDPAVHPKVFNMVRSRLITTHQLLSVRNDVLNTGPVVKEPNSFLKNLNSSGGISRFVSPGSAGAGEVETLLIVGLGEKTIKTIEVGMPHPDGIYYKDGMPEVSSFTPTFTTSGDGTVLSESVTQGFTGPDIKYVQSSHASVVKNARSLITDFLVKLTLQSAPAYLQKTVAKNQKTSRSSVAPSDTQFSLNIKGSVQGYLTSPGGQVSGIKNKTQFTDIPGSSVNFDANSGSIAVNGASDGAYTLVLAGGASEDFLVSLDYMNASGAASRSFTGFSHGMPITITLTVNSTAADRVTMNTTPVHPTGLQADLLVSGGMKTRLSWSSSAGAASYRVYGKDINEPFFKQIGTAIGLTFDTADSWAADSTVMTRVYALAAVSAAGTESFLSDIALNDDRDHDGLPDALEAALGTDINNPDTDGDSIRDGLEYKRGTNPLLTDSDGDGASDGIEAQVGTDPLNPNYFPLARLATTPTVLYLTPREAYSAALTGETIQVRASAMAGDLLFDRDIAITLKCGFDKTFSASSLSTQVSGIVTIGSGTVFVENLVVR